MNRSRLLQITTFLAFTAIAVYALPSPAVKTVADEGDECVGCSESKPIIPPGVSYEDATRAHVEGMKARARANAQAAKQRRQIEMTQWKGTEMVMNNTVGENTRNRFANAHAFFSPEPKMPEARRQIFQKPLNGHDGFKCVGWTACMTDIEDNEDGQLVTIAVRPRIMHRDHEAIMPLQTCTEKWQVYEDGTMQVLEVIDNGPAGVYAIY